MKFSRYSLTYLATYLTLGGLGFLFIPTQFSKLLFSNVTYQEIPLRLAGMFSLLLGIVVVQIVRHQLEVLYPTSLVARFVGLIALLVFYFNTHNPMFLTLSVIVTIGFVATIASFILEKRQFKL